MFFADAWIQSQPTGQVSPMSTSSCQAQQRMADFANEMEVSAEEVLSGNCFYYNNTTKRRKLTIKP